MEDFETLLTLIMWGRQALSIEAKKQLNAHIPSTSFQCARILRLIRDSS